ncbi:MAG: MOSC domain-containing protein [Gammaproteobacteria bacterium]|nr:MOSC domain-containing protein [Gammaproteobacteria bacterium]
MRITGTVVDTLTGRNAESLVTTSESEISLNFDGVAGDRHAGLTRAADVRFPHYPRGTPIRNTRQLSIVSVEELREIATTLQLPELPAAWLGANLLLDGIAHLTRIPAGSRMFFPSGAALAIEGENLPCRGPGRVIELQHPDRAGIANQFPKAAMHLRGLVAWVERPGVIHAGDQVEVEIARIHAYPV